jgi:DNA-binding NarL/FixJ family response regulator
VEFRRLKGPSTILLINKPISLLLLAVLENYCRENDKYGVDAYDTKSTSKDEIEEAIGLARERGYASELGGRDESIRAGGILDESWRCGVHVATAIELMVY